MKKQLMSIAALAMFECYCRAGEILALRMFQIIPGDPHASGAAACTTLVLNPQELQVASKTGEMDSSIPLDMPEHAWIGQSLLQLKRFFKDQPLTKLVPEPYGEFLEAIHQASQQLGVGALEVTPHCFRHLLLLRTIFEVRRSREKTFLRERASHLCGQ